MDRGALTAMINNAITYLDTHIHVSSSSDDKVKTMNEIKDFLQTYYENDKKEDGLRYCTPKMLTSLKTFLERYQDKKYNYMKDIFCLPLNYSKKSKTVEDFLEYNLTIIENILNPVKAEKNGNIAKSMSNKVIAKSEFEKIKILNAEFSWLNALSSKNILIDPTMIEALSQDLGETFRAWNDESKITNRQLLASRIDTAKITLQCIIARLPTKQTNNITKNIVKKNTDLKSASIFFGGLFKKPSNESDASTIRSDQSGKFLKSDALSQKSGNTIISDISNLTQMEEPKINDVQAIKDTLDTYVAQLQIIKNNVDSGKNFEDIIEQLNKVEHDIINIVDPLLQNDNLNILVTNNDVKNGESETLNLQYQYLNNEKHVKEVFAVLSPLAQLMHNVHQFKLDPYKEKHANKPS